MGSAILRALVEHWSARLKVAPAQIRVQAMTRKWASCSSRGRVTFCRDLLAQPPSFQDYVIAHELLHLRIPNHGKLFAATLRAHLRGNPWLDGKKQGAAK
ncbi:MAG: M48 family metallopeptidase [Lysobacter sp.]